MATSYYSIIQYVPNPITDERINVGVVAFDAQIVKVKFLSNWQRVKDFSLDDINFLYEFQDRMQILASQGLLFPGDCLNGQAPQERLQKVAENWMNSIQFTEPSASLESLDILFKDTINEYLVEPKKAEKIVPKMVRDRKGAIKITKNRFLEVVTTQLGEAQAEHLIRPNYQIKGHLKSHKLDITVANGRPYFAAQAISFEVKVPENSRNSISFLIGDIQREKPNFPLGIVTLPPKEDQSNYKENFKLYQETKRIYEELGAKVIEENELDFWIKQELDLIR
jgi:hypothetical protein